MKSPLLLCTLLLTPAALAQGVTLGWTPSVNIPGLLPMTLAGPAGQPFFSLLDFDGGPRDLFGARFHLGLTPALAVAATGSLDPNGNAVAVVTVPNNPALAGVALYHQAVVLDPSAPNQVFRVSNPQSTCLYRAASALTLDFANLSLFTGTFDPTVTGRLQGGPVLHRSVSTIDPQGVVFGQPLRTPLDPFGTRLQMVYRPRDLGSAGDEELVTGIEWKVHSTTNVISDFFPRIAIDLGHSDIAPDYTIDPLSALPMFPNSGLTTSFAGNYRPGTSGTRVYDGPYVINPANLQPGRYLPFPDLQTLFPYDGEDSLLVDVRVYPSALPNGLNGNEVRLMVQSSPLPGARAVARGRLGTPLDPDTANAAQTADNAMHDLRIHFARARTEALSPFLLGSQLAAPDYLTPIVAATVPAGTRIVIEYRGAMSPLGSRATPFSTNIDVADGFSYVQVRIAFHGNPATDEVPSIDTLVIPSN